MACQSLEVTGADHYEHPPDLTCRIFQPQAILNPRIDETMTLTRTPQIDFPQ